jgi:hypothetical protein
LENFKKNIKIFNTLGIFELILYSIIGRLLCINNGCKAEDKKKPEEKELTLHNGRIIPPLYHLQMRVILNKNSDAFLISK